MVAADWRLHRAQVVATAINDRSLFDHRAQDDRENANCDHDYRLGINQTRIEQELAFVERSEARCERAHARALAEFVVLRKLRPADAQPIQLDRHDVTTTGRDPAQYLGPVATPQPNPPENVANEPKPPTPAESEHIDPEPCIMIPDYPRFEEEPLDDPPYFLHSSGRNCQTKGDGRGFRPPQEMKIRPFNAIAVSTSYAYFRKNPSRSPNLKSSQLPCIILPPICQDPGEPENHCIPPKNETKLNYPS